MGIMISGFMIAKNLLKQGYPFVEAIASALPICDEFLISDGYSTDGTYEMLQKMAALNKKIKISRYNWLKTKSLNVLTDATNEVRKMCNFEYIFYVQANEIVPETDVASIKSLPEILPQAHTFCLPYLHLMGNQKWAEQFRLRFSKNEPGIVAVGDAWTLGPSKDFVRSVAVKSLRNPRKLIRYIGSGIEYAYANSFSNVCSRAIYLPKPVFRYYSLFPRDFLEKSKNHAEMFGDPDFYRTINVLSDKTDDYDSFWREAANFFRAELTGSNNPAFGAINREEHPKIMQDLISNTELNSYYVREKVLESIAGL